MHPGNGGIVQNWEHTKLETLQKWMMKGSYKWNNIHGGLTVKQQPWGGIFNLHPYQYFQQYASNHDWKRCWGEVICKGNDVLSWRMTRFD